MMNSLEEAIKHCEEVAEKLEKQVKPYQCESINKKLYEVNKKEWDSCIKCAKDHRQLAEWLKELKESRMVLDILGQFLVDTDLDVCCEDLAMIDDYCEKYCDNQKPLCWYRWAKIKAREVNANG